MEWPEKPDPVNSVAINNPPLTTDHRIPIFPCATGPPLLHIRYQKRPPPAALFSLVMRYADRHRCARAQLRAVCASDRNGVYASPAHSKSLCAKIKCERAGDLPGVFRCLITRHICDLAVGRRIAFISHVHGQRHQHHLVVRGPQNVRRRRDA